MNDQRLGLCTLLSLASAVALPACSVDDHANAAYRDPRCKTALYREYCVPEKDQSDTPPTDADVLDGADAQDAALDAGDDKPSNPSLAGQACAPEGDEQLCYDGPDRTKAKGACVSGVQKCNDGTWSDCFGQVIPSDETCNASDDDCDGEVDEDIQADCVAPGTGCAGVLICQQGRPICAATVDPLPEACNAIDDDCDGKTDEGTDQACADDNFGCSASGDGRITCKGVCRAGVRRCQGGALDSACGDQTKPEAKERCGLEDGVAVDEDCDGHTDETCPCTGNGSRPCYSGADSGHTLGACKPGMQTCSGGEWGACEGEVTPQPEACPNDGADNDCNGAVDDVHGLGVDCASSELGRCHNGKQQCVDDAVLCVTPKASDELCNGIDDDCNGSTDEAFQLQTDEDNCGRCGMDCVTDSTCCSGTCVDTETSNGHCGTCNHICQSGTSCCGANCVDFRTDKNNCGTCGHACDGSETCCSGTCFNLKTDAKHCGTCQKACLLNLLCLNGDCALL